MNDLYFNCHLGTWVCIATYWRLSWKCSFWVILKLQNVKLSAHVGARHFPHGFAFGQDHSVQSQESSWRSWSSFHSIQSMFLSLSWNSVRPRLFLLFWHDVKWLFCCRGKRVFLDRCCIHQNDEDLKQQGIEHLDVFLQLSDKMLVTRAATNLVSYFVVSVVFRETKAHQKSQVVYSELYTKKLLGHTDINLITHNYTYSYTVDSCVELGWVW